VAPDLFNERIGQHWPEQHANPSHDHANGSSKFGEVFYVRFTGFLRLAPGVPSLAQLDRDLFPGLLRLLELGSGL
jgi:hypothetical protein